MKQDVKEAIEAVVSESERFESETEFIESAVFQMIDMERTVYLAPISPSVPLSEAQKSDVESPPNPFPGTEPFEQRHLEKYE